MRLHPILCVVALLVSSSALADQGRSTPLAEQGSPTVSLGLGYDSVLANAGPGQCGCFFLSGGHADLRLGFTGRWSAVADLGGGTASTVNGNPNGLSLVTVTGGPRLALRHPADSRGKVVPYVEALAGFGHAFNTFVPIAQPKGSANGLALVAGGGLDLRVSRVVAIRPVEVDYLLTRIPNGNGNYQNNLRFSAGVLFQFR
jgi:outer membrane immunogenic protein